MTDRSTQFQPATDVRILAAPHQAFGVLRLGRDCGAEVLALLDEALGLALPRTPNTAVGARTRALWTGPREWTLIDATPIQIETVHAIAPGALSHYAELGAARVGFTLVGEDAGRLIASECPFDLEALEPDRCAQSAFAGMPILLDRRRGEEGFWLYVDVSLAGHMRSWLTAAAEGLG